MVARVAHAPNRARRVKERSVSTSLDPFPELAPSTFIESELPFPFQMVSILVFLSRDTHPSMFILQIRFIINPDPEVNVSRFVG